MSASFDLDKPPEKVLDELQIAETETGDKYTVTLSGGELAVASLDGDDVQEPSIKQLDLWLRHGEYYIPEYSPATHVYQAVEQLMERDA